MDIHGIRLGRKMDGRLIVANLSAGGQIFPIVPRNENRVALGFYYSGNQFVTLSPDSAVVALNGIFISNQSQKYEITIDQWGELVKRAWYAISAAPTIFVWTESCLDGNPLDT